MRRIAASCCWAWLAFFPAIQALRAEVVRIELSETKPYASGRSFERFGPYEMRRGRVFFAVDPAIEANARIVDLTLAPENEKGLVEFSADLQILCPKDLSKTSGTLLYDVNNRGNPTCLGQFNGGADEFLCRQGFIIVWSGWIAETFPGNGRLRLQAPVALENGELLRGTVRAEMVTNKEAARLNIAQWANQGSYPPVEEELKNAILTWRLREKDRRVPIPREQWRLEPKFVEADGQKGQLPLIEMILSGGFQPGYIYELIYEAEGSLVQGTGFAGIRDLVSFLKHDDSPKNPLTVDGHSAVKRTLGFGTSQSGRALRAFLHDGFNADERGRQVFDGVMPHVAGGGMGSFNHRFASPTRHNAQHDNHMYPVDVFPFAYGDLAQASPQVDILQLSRFARAVPKVMHTQTSAEYWNRCGSLVHTDLGGHRDAKLPSAVRIYAFGGCQHGAGNGMPGERGPGQLPANPSDYRPLLRGLLVALDAWVREDCEPPESVYPRISDGTLGDPFWPVVDMAGRPLPGVPWHPLPGVRYPGVIQQPIQDAPGISRLSLSRIARCLELPRTDPRYLTAFPESSSFVRVPAVGPDNNELGMLMLPSVAVPLATYTGWNLRHRSIGAENELLSLTGGYIPLPRTTAEARAAGDPRPSIESLYRDFDDYRQKYLAVARELVEKRYMLPEELPRLEKAVERHRPIFEKR